MPDITGLLTLADDLTRDPVGSLPRAVRKGINASPDSVVLSRLRSREPNQVVDADGASLIGQFATPRRVVEAVIDYCRSNGLDPRRTLISAYPMLRELVRLGFLVPPTDGVTVPRAQLEPGSRLEGFRVLRCIRLLDDTEVYQVAVPGGRLAALKRARAVGPMTRMLAHEARVLRRLGGGVAPLLLGAGSGAVAEDRGVAAAIGGADLAEHAQ